MDGLFNLLKPAQSVRDGDKETLLQDFKDYVEVMQKFVTTTGGAGESTVNHMDCRACKKEKAMMILIGGKELYGLKHAG